MCGRYTLRVSPAELAEIFETLRTIEWSPRYNIAPTQTVVAVRQGEQGRELARVRWGLIPSWAKDAKIGNNLINARADGVATKPSFRHAFKKKRCLIPVDGFYEWQVVPGQKTKQPFHIGLQDAPVFAFAGLWESWTDPEGKPVESSSIITTDANEAMAAVHNRMPVILDPKDYDEWLDRGN
jgi:putative SOS response-associated peptidase YedK